MGKDSSIQWTTHTFNPWRGCTKVSPGCANCYAEAGAKRNPAVLGRWGPGGTRVVASEAKWSEVLAFDRAAKDAGERHRVFCASLADVFEVWDGPMVTSKGHPFWWCHGSLSNSPIPSTGLTEGCRLATMDDIRERLFQTIEDTPNLDYLLVTKRAERVLPTLARMGRSLPPNVWLGTTVEDQERADERIPHLLRCPAAVCFLSVEPMLGPVDLDRYLWSPGGQTMTDLGPEGYDPEPSGDIDWVIVGGESGPHARPFDLAWARSIRDQCQAAGVAFFMKQLGASPVGSWFPEGTPVTNDRLDALPGRTFGVDGHWKLKDSHGGDWDEWPSDLRVREFPRSEVVA